MASLPIRDPVGDHLLTPKNSALAVIDYQPSQLAGVRSMDRDLGATLARQLAAGGEPVVRSATSQGKAKSWQLTLEVRQARH